MGAWIEIKYEGVIVTSSAESHPTMGAWIEIVGFHLSTDGIFVAPHDGCVD